ncbi:MAG TPA: hypothetical protein VIH85_09540 [Solirubrobacteraceae bacterium]
MACWVDVAAVVLCAVVTGGATTAVGLVELTELCFFPPLAIAPMMISATTARRIHRTAFLMMLPPT